ncbi:MAG: DUF2723 domain-containing protein [candidate division Zixibacteria bacterium]|nr:DUF2723 domain-containing protein [candidate division Zixibacteria bacterium]
MQWFDKPTIREKAIMGGAIFIATFGVYIFTLCPTIYWEDSAAFCAVHSLLGIPHSPGFPVYVIWGGLFTMIPISNPAFSSNLMSAFWGSLALALLYLLIIEIFNQTKSSRLFSRLATTTSILFFAFSTSFWLQSIRAEVYTQNIFFTLLLIFLIIKWWHFKESVLGFRILLLFSFILGLSLTNHPLLIITLVPAFALLFFSADFKSLLNPKTLLLLAIFLMLGVSLYLYLPIRSNLSPLINWGKPDSWSNLLSYLFRTSQPSMLSSGFSFPYLNRLWFNLSFPVAQFGLAFFWLSIVGAISLFKSYQRIFFLTFLIFILNVLAATWAADFSLRNYDLLGYLLPSLSVFTIWFAWGLKASLGWIFKEVRTIQANPVNETNKVVSYMVGYALLGLVLLLPLFQVWKNFDQCNKRSQTWAYGYAHQILSSVKKDALILVGDDNTLTSLWYLNLSQKIRPDVKILSISALSQKSYREQISQQYRKVKLPRIKSKNWGRIAHQVSEQNADNFPIYSTYLSFDTLFVQHLRPAGYLFEFCPKRVILTDKAIKEQKDFLKRNLKHKNFDIITREHLGNLIFNLGVFYDQKGGLASSIEYFLWALDVDPSNSRIYFQLGKAFLKSGDKSKALDFFQAGLELDPYNLEARKLLEKT